MVLVHSSEPFAWDTVPFNTVVIEEVAFIAFYATALTPGPPCSRSY